MEAVILKSRAISQDPFFQKEQQSKYQKHMRSIRTITSEKLKNLEGWSEEVASMASTLRKSKSAAKVFRQREDKSQLKKDNMTLLKRIWHLEPTVDTFKNDKFQYVSGSNWHQQKKKMGDIKVENQKIASKMHTHDFKATDYKKKLRDEIKEYIELREHVRKFKPKQSPQKRVASERKLVKLEKIVNEKENIEAKKKESEGHKNTEEKGEEIRGERRF